MAKKDEKKKEPFDLWEWLLGKSVIVATLIIFGYAGLSFAVAMVFLWVFLKLYGR